MQQFLNTLFVLSEDAYLTLDGENVVVSRGKAEVGRVPLHTLRADIDYGFFEARTTCGRIGVQVWIYKGEILDKEVDQ